MLGGTVTAITRICRPRRVQARVTPTAVRVTVEDERGRAHIELGADEARRLAYSLLDASADLSTSLALVQLHEHHNK